MSTRIENISIHSIQIIFILFWYLFLIHTFWLRGGVWHKQTWEVMEAIFRTSCASEPRWAVRAVRARCKYLIVKWWLHSPRDTTSTDGPSPGARSVDSQHFISELRKLDTILYEMKITTRPCLMLFVIALTKVRMTQSYDYSIRIGMDNDD